MLTLSVLGFSLPFVCALYALTEAHPHTQPPLTAARVQTCGKWHVCLL